jgi:hypothetical protein
VHPNTIAEVAAGAAAVAALASWASVAQSSRWQKRERQPELSIDLSQNLDTNQIQIRVTNTGGGIAKGVNFWALEGSMICAGGLPPHATLAPGAGVTLSTSLIPVKGSRNVRAVVMCRGGDYMHAWTAAGIHRKWPLRTLGFDRKAPSFNDQVRELYPDVGDPAAYTLVRSDLISST